jgi:TPR repeat protein
MGLRDGIGVRRDLRAAARWFGRAAARGDSEAQADFAHCLHEGRGVRRNRVAAAQLYRRAAQAGVVRAQFNLGLCYLAGHGVRQNTRNARTWLSRAAAHRHSRARELLATVLLPNSSPEADRNEKVILKAREQRCTFGGGTCETGPSEGDTESR